MAGDDLQEFVFDRLLGVWTPSAVRPYRIAKGVMRDYQVASDPRRIGGDPSHAAADAVYGDYMAWVRGHEALRYLEKNNDLPVPANPYFANKQSKEAFDYMFWGRVPRREVGR
jgi:hypothetical protein